MKAVVYHGPNAVTVEDVPRPAAEPGDVVLRVLSNTICNTDLRIATGLKRKGVIAPRILGHELAGEVVELGDGVTGIAVGDRVGVVPTYHCGDCAECRRGRFNLCTKALVLGHQTDGGLAEYIRIPAHAVRDGVLVPFDSSLDPVAVSLVEPLSCIVHGQRFLQVGESDVVLILGGGAIGLLHAKVAKLSGASKVIVSEPQDFRRRTATTFGADVVVDPTVEDLAAIVAAETGGRGADVVIVAIGVPSVVQDALQLSANRGRISLFAGFPVDVPAPIDANLIHYKELTVVGSSNSTVEDYRQALTLLEEGVLHPESLVTHRFDLDHFDDALHALRQPDTLKVAVVPQIPSP